MRLRESPAVSRVYTNGVVETAAKKVKSATTTKTIETTETTVPTTLEESKVSTTLTIDEVTRALPLVYESVFGSEPTYERHTNFPQPGGCRSRSRRRNHWSRSDGRHTGHGTVCTTSS